MYVFSRDLPDLVRYFSERNPFGIDDEISGANSTVHLNCPRCKKPHSASLGDLRRNRRVHCEDCTKVNREEKKRAGSGRTLKELNPEVYSMIVWARHPELSKTVTTGSGVKLTFRCERGHEWKRKLNVEVNSAVRCKYCENMSVWTGFNDLATRHPKLAEEWDSERNSTTSDQVLFKSAQRAWWLCELGHSYQKRVVERLMGRGCDYCEHRKLLTGFSDLQTRAPKMANELKDSTLDSTRIFILSREVLDWICEKGHTWSASPSRRYTRGSGCAACKSLRLVVGENDFLTCYPDLASEWDYSKNEKTPQEITGSTGEMTWWLCRKCGCSYSALVPSRVYRNKGCPNCSPRSLVQRSLLEFLFASVDGSILYDDRSTISPRELDFVLPESKKAIEFNGDYWHSEAMVQKNYGMSSFEYHASKLEDCRRKGIDLAFVWEDDWKNKRTLVEDQLLAWLRGGELSPFLKRTRSRLDGLLD